MTARQPDEDDAALFTLHRYFIWTNRMREHLQQTLHQQGPMPDTTPEMSDQQREAAELGAREWLLPVFLYGSYWLASLHVVVEGWQTLKLTDPSVDAQLDQQFLDLLRRYRNGVFHYQPSYLDARVDEFMQGSKGNRAGQAGRPHDALEMYFRRWFERRGESPFSPPSGG